MTITREQFRELAQFQDGNSCAVSFYFQPSTPRNKAHKEDTILIKDLVREASRSLESKSPEGRGPFRFFILSIASRSIEPTWFDFKNLQRP